MLSITATNVLAVVDPSALRHPPSSLPSCLTPAEEYGASAWATDSTLYLSSAQTISRFDLPSNQLKSVYTLEEGCIIRSLLAKDKSSIVFSAGDKAHILECSGPTARVVRTFGSHKRDILSLSLSNDSTLLACGLPDGVYVHNLTTGSHTVLRGLPPGIFTIVCVFHPYTRTRLLVGCEDQLFVYDTTRPSAPSKVIPLSENGSHISAIACSPFSKTLVAVAMRDGVVGLVDLDKEKGLFRKVDLKVSLTTIAFSPEGASIYLGTEHGRLLVQDLRALDKPPKSVVVSESGNIINTLAVWKKTKDSPDDTKSKATPKSSVKNLPGTPSSKSISSPMRRVTRTSTASATPLRAVLKAGKPKPSPLSRTTDPKKVLSPARDPHGNSPSSPTAAGIAKSATVKTKKSTSISSASPSLKPRSSSARAALVSELSTRRTASAIRTRKATEPAEPTFTTHLETTTTAPEAISSISSARNRIRSRATSSVSLTPSDSAPTVSSHPVHTTSSASTSSTTSRRKRASPTELEPVPPVPPIPSDFISNLRPISLAAKPREDSRTPSPDLPDMRTDPVTPIPPHMKKKSMAVLGMGTPEVKAWIKAGAGTSGQNRQISKGKGRTKSVGFKEGESEPEDEGRAEELDGLKPDEDGEYEREKSLSLQISPHRPLPTSTPSHTQSHGPSLSWDASPLRPRHPAHVPGTPTAGSAHELLKTIVTDVMYDFQRETKAEMMGLHLDLVRMGRGWRQELRTLMEEYVGDLSDLREENRRLREENEKLRRGY